MEKILAIDDEEDILMIIKTALEVKGYEVKTAESVTEGFGLIKKEKYPVILSDIMMPGIDGLTFLKMIKKEFPDVIVILISALLTIDSAREALNEGAFAYLTKPIKLDELRQTVQKAFEKYRLIEENKKLIKELQKEKEFNDTVINNIFYIVLGINPDGTIQKINKATEKFLGYTQEEITGFPMSVIFTEEFQEKNLSDFISSGVTKDYIVSFLNKNKEEIKTTFSGTILKNTQGVIIGLLGTVKKLEDNLNGK